MHLQTAASALKISFSRAIHTRSPLCIVKTIDRPLPDVVSKTRQNRRYFIMFCGAMALSLGAMIKYEAANSPIVTSTLQAIRRSPTTIAVLGPNVRFSSAMPWISGNSGIAKAIVDFSYEARGDISAGTVHFRATKVPGELRYTMERWSVTPHEGPQKGVEISLINEEYVPHVPTSNSEEPSIVRNN